MGNEVDSLVSRIRALSKVDSFDSRIETLGKNLATDSWVVPIVEVADTAEIALLWFEQNFPDGGFNGADVMSMTRLILERKEGENNE